jgi:hypothetical protein
METVTYVANIYKYYIAYKLVAEREEERKRAFSLARPESLVILELQVASKPTRPISGTEELPRRWKGYRLRIETKIHRDFFKAKPRCRYTAQAISERRKSCLHLI